MPRKLRVFLCHASDDKPAVRKLYASLKSELWIDPWLDEENLHPGQDWDLGVYKAIRDADAIVICLSQKSVSKEGYVQKEIKRALDISDEKPDGTIYIIPLRLDECEVPLRIAKWQWVNHFKDDGCPRLLETLRIRASSIGLELISSEKNDELRWALQERSQLARLNNAIQEAEILNKKGTLPSDLMEILIAAKGALAEIKRNHTNILRSSIGGDLDASRRIREELENTIIRNGLDFYDYTVDSIRPTWEVLRRASIQFEKISDQEMRSAFDLVSKILVEHPFYAAQLLQMELMKSYHESYKNEIQEKLEEVDKFIQQRQKVIFSFMSVLNEIDKEIVRLITLNGWGSQKLAGELHMDLATVDSNVLQIFDKFRAHFELEHADTNTLSTILGPYWGKADKIS